MARPELRRSQRLGTPDSNGRDYLSSKLGWIRVTFEDWIYSSTVRPHLQDWYGLCISNSSRFNDVADWVNTGEKGYFYNEHDLEDDLLLLCLGAGDDGNIEACVAEASLDFVRDTPSPQGWITQELWARTAWRITQANRECGQIFHFAIQDRPAAAYGIVIEMLCIVFHSVAFRGSASVYLRLLTGDQARGSMQLDQVVDAGVAHFDATFDDHKLNDETETSSSSAVDRTSDTTFSDPRRVVAASERSTIIIRSKNVPGADDIGSTIEDARQPSSAAGSDTETSALTDGTSFGGMEGGGKQEPLTPDTRFSAFADRAPAEEDDGAAGKAERVRMWLDSTTGV